MEIVSDGSTFNSSSVSNAAVSLRNGNPDANPEDTFKILIATDIHLGVHEKDPIRCDDSFNTFEEILATAEERNVDLILLGGDLFHESKPSSSSYVKAISLMRKYTMGDKPINMAFENDDSKLLFRNSIINDVNYQDPNQNFAFPIFSIHGNHDDPSGSGRTSALDVLSSTGLVNYFGVCHDLTNIVLKPVLLRKGRTKLAIYGISHIRDERLSRLMEMGAVKYEQPRKPESWFKILVLHQNRVPRPGTKHIQEKWIPDFIDVVIWGHEHDCLITPEPSQEADKTFYIIQPGSPVATSLSEGEAKEKKIGVLNVFSKQFYLDEIKLKTVRPFVFHTESTADWNAKVLSKKNSFADIVRKFVNTKLLKQAEALLTGHPKQPTLPLIRLRLELEKDDYEFNKIRFGQQFYSGVVANPSDMLMFKTAFSARGTRLHNNLLDDADLEDLLDTSGMKAESLAPQFFEIPGNEGKELKVLSLRGMCEAVTYFIEKDDKQSVFEMVNHQVSETCKFLDKQSDLSSDAAVIHQLIQRFKEIRSGTTNEDEINSARQYLDGDNRLNTTMVNIDIGAPSSAAGSTQAQQSRAGEHTMSDDDDMFFPNDQELATTMDKPSRGRGRGRGRGRAAASKASVSTTSSRGRKKVADNNSTVSSISDYMSTTTAASGANKRGTMLNFFTKGASSGGRSMDGTIFDDVAASPKKKARMEYLSDSD